MEASAEPVAVFDHTGAVSYVNSAFSRVFGWNLVSLPLNQDTFVPPRYRDEFRQVLGKVMAGGTVSGLETRRIASDGVTRDILLSAAAFGDGSGQPCGAVVNFIDVTEWKATERRFRDLFNGISDFVYTLDMDGRFLSANPALCRGLGVGIDELVGMPITAFMSDGYRTLFSEEVVPLILRNGRHHGMLLLAGSGGKDEYLEFRAVLQDADAIEPVISATGRFVTDRIEAEKELRTLKDQLVQAQKMEAVGTLTTGISHDFNNLLQAIIQPIQLALENRYLDYKERRFLDIAAMSARRGADLVQQLLTFSRKVEPRFEIVNLPDVVDQAVELLAKTLPKSIRIIITHGPEILPVSADPSQVQQMIMNLGINARDAMPSGGSLIVETRTAGPADLPPGLSSGDYSVVVVSDTGCGIPEEIRSKIFEPFFTTKEKSRNTGLGLSMVYGIMQTHRGHVSCDSTPGRGSRFCLFFPALALPESLLSGAAEPVEAGAPCGQGRCVLMVEDEEYIREIVVEVLRMSGFEVLEAVNGKEALQIYASRKESIDLVVLDLNMPVMGGRECLTQLLGMNPAVNVIVATGSSDMDEIEAIRGQGARGIISKPYTSAELLKAARGIGIC
jgi:PAS domain S-box-containing protein